MTDRELLENAAKAAGIFDLRFDNKGVAYRNVHIEWNPLSDDGDAFRLAVELKLDIVFDAESAYPHHVHVEQYDMGLGFRENLLDGPYAATRRAIVKAAAEIGWGMT